MKAGVMLLAALLALAAAGIVASAQEDQQVDLPEGLIRLGKAVGAGLAVGLAGIGAGSAVAAAGAAAISAVAEKREMFGISLLFVVLGEGIAIYGIVIAILIIFVI